MGTTAGGTDERKRCFVVMGFGKKPDFATGRTLNLDSTYRTLIKPVVEEAGLDCVRADEILHSGVIDVPMYQQLLLADVVIADLSTANVNAVYELGVRHALRPRTTIVISEDKLKYPFDLNHISITSYAHLGDDFALAEVERFRKLLGDKLRTVLAAGDRDSPVFTFLPLAAPDLDSVRRAIDSARDGAAVPSGERKPAAAAPDDRTLAFLVSEGEKAIRRSDFPAAKAMFQSAKSLGEAIKDAGCIKADAYVLQRLALATYKAELPDRITALGEALKILETLGPEDSRDPETVGLSGAIEKRLFESGAGLEHLFRAVRYYGRGYYLCSDWYNGINFAYLLNVQADAVAASEKDRIADLVWANRIRREVLGVCIASLAAIEERQKDMAVVPDDIRAAQRDHDRDQAFWCLASKAEAHFGLGEFEMFKAARAQAQARQPAAWMIGSLDRQIEKLRPLLHKHGGLLDPPWRDDAGS